MSAEGPIDPISHPGYSDGLGPVAQAIRIGFITLRLALGLLAVAWGASNIRQVPADRRVVVMRFGHVARIQEAGLVLAWPSPIEQIISLPGADRQITLPMGAHGDGSQSVETDFQIHQPDDAVSLRPMKDTMNAAYLLTGDGSVVQFDATLFYSITDPRSYVLAADHVEPALGRLYRASAVALAATRDLDDFLVARPERHEGSALDSAGRRERLAADMVNAINARLARLGADHADLGVTVRRVDILALLPPLAKSAFDSVLTVAQTAEQQEAASRTEAATHLQQAEQDRDHALATAEAVAQERVQGAKASVAAMRALAASGDTPSHRDSMMQDFYRERVGPILGRAGQVTTVDAVAGQHLVLLGGSHPGDAAASEAVPAP